MNDTSPSPPRSPSRTSRRIAIVLVLVTVLVRGIVCFGNLDRYSADPDGYVRIAETLNRTGTYAVTSEGQVFATAFRPPLYPYALSRLVIDGEVSHLGVAALHTILACITVLCTYRASRRLLGEVDNYRASILAAGLVIVDPILLQQSMLVMTETMATAAASVVLWWWVRHTEWSSSIGSAVILAGFLVLAFFCRPTFLVWAAMICVFLARAESFKPVSLGWCIGRAALTAAIIAVAVGLWAIRNASQPKIDHPVWATTHGGYTLLLGNNPLFYDYLREGSFGRTWDIERFQTAYKHLYDGDPNTREFWYRDWSETDEETPGRLPVTEHQYDQRTYQAARATISRNFGTFLWSCVVRVYRLWTPLPHATEQRSWTITICVALYYTALYIAIGIGVRNLGSRWLHQRAWPLFALILTLTIVHAVYWSNVRMRAPAIPVMTIMAAAAIRRPEQRDE